MTTPVLNFLSLLAKIILYFAESTLFAVMIEGRGISQSLRTLFEMAWENALPYEKVINLARGAEGVR